MNGEDQLDAWVIEGRRVIPLLKRMAPKTGVSAIADKVARYQVKQNELEAVSRANNSVGYNEQSSFELEEQLSGRANNSANSPANAVVGQATRKRVNSCESTTAKRKYQVSSKLKEISLKQHSDRLANSSTPTSGLPSITIPACSLSSGCPKSENSILTTTDKAGQPKLLIMSTGSVLNKPTIVNTSALSGNQQQLINLDLEASASKHQLQSIPQPITPSCTSGNKSSSAEAPASSSLAHQLIATSQSAKVYNPKVQSTSPKLMILPNSSQTKTLTIPISHKTLQLPAQNLPNSTILYSQQPIVTGTAGGLMNCSTSGTLKSMPGITIQAIKTTQSGSKSNSNFIIMPNKAANSVGGQQLSQTTVSGAKGLLRQVNAKEFPVQFLSSTTAPDGLAKKESTERADPNDRVQQQQQRIILTNVSKETANSLANSPIRNLVHPNIIKVVPKCAASNSMQQANKTAAGRQTSTNQKAFHPITIPAGNATAFMEILKNIPINRISPQLSNSDGKTTQISITPNSAGSTITKTIKIPANSTSESISKLIFNNVMTSNSLSNAGRGSSAVSTRKAPKSGGPTVTDVKGGLVNRGPVNSETAKKGLDKSEVNQSADEKSETDKNLVVGDLVDEESNSLEENVSKDAVDNDTAGTESISLNDDSREKRSLNENSTTGVSSKDQVVEST